MTAEGTDFTIYREAMIVLATAAVLVPIGQRFKLSPILGFLIAGAVLGPHGLGALTDYVPALSWITVSEDKGLGAIAELGVVFLLFLIGLELSFQRLVDHAPAGVRARQPAGRAVDGRDRPASRRCSATAAGAAIDHRLVAWRCPRPRS